MTTDEAFGPRELGWTVLRDGRWGLQSTDGCSLTVQRLQRGRAWDYRWTFLAPDGVTATGTVRESLRWAQGDAELALWDWRRSPRRPGRRAAQEHAARLLRERGGDASRP